MIVSLLNTIHVILKGFPTLDYTRRMLTDDTFTNALQGSVADVSLIPSAFAYAFIFPGDLELSASSRYKTVEDLKKDLHHLYQLYQHKDLIV